MSDQGTRAFVPGHVTGFFSVHEGETPLETGSRGGGIVLSEGVTTTIRPGEPAVYLNGTSAGIEPVERVLDALNADATVAVETDLPVGAGFGVSGAAALGTALAVDAAFDRALSENELVTVAHGAEVQSGTGLGDVVAQARGGVPLRLQPGAPGHNDLDGIPAEGRIEYCTLDDLSTEAVLADDTAALSEAGEDALELVRREPTMERFMRFSRQFAREAELLTPEVRDAVEAVSEAGGEASMAMLGETVFALGSGLSDAGYDPEVAAIDPAGATLLR